MRRIFDPRLLYVAYFFGVAGIFLTVFAKYCARAQGPLPPEMVKGLLPLVELAILGGLGVIISPMRRVRSSIWRWGIYLILPLAIGIVYVAQSYSLYLSNSYITVLAMENSAESRLTTTWLLRAMVGAVVLGWAFLLFSHTSRRYREARQTSRLFVGGWAVVLVGYLVAFLATSHERGVISLQKNQAPLLSLLRTTYILAERRMDEFRPAASEFDGDIYFVKGNEFPFKKNYIYSSALPFEKIVQVKKKRNVIVIFTEGMSARLINAYGGRHPGLTPNIDALLARSMRVDNYYNHTAATYRGLQGQMASGYPGTGGAQSGSGWDEGENSQSLARIHYRTLPQIFRERGYDTYFFSPHHDSVQLNTMLRSLEFDQVYSFDSLNNEFLQGKATLTAGSLSDKDLFRSLNVMLESRARAASDKPFFIGLYDIGTHAFLDVPEGYEKYGDGKNSVLNRMHNYDRQIGQFLNYFFSSKYAKDTILVFTADHATYPEPPFVDAVRGENYQPYFVDRIPLAIYDPAHVLPQEFDADGRSSIDFAPTLLHLLGVQKVANSFIGRSIFDAKRIVPFGVAAIGGDIFMTTRDGVVMEPGVPLGDKEQFLKYADYIRTYYTLEKENRIFPDERVQIAHAQGQDGDSSERSASAALH